MLTRRPLHVVAIAAALVVLPALSAAAGPCNAAGFCEVEVGTPGRPGGGQPISNPGPGGGSGGGGGGGGNGIVLPPAPPPQFQANDTLLPDGSTERCWTIVTQGAVGPPTLFECTIIPPGQPLPAAPVGTPPVDPAVLAQQAVAALQVSAPQIGIVPEMGPGRLGVVGAPVWMWTPPEQWANLTESASAGGLTVTAVATLANVSWDMGDGTTVTCDEPGTPYERRYGVRMSPDCGHRYEQTSVDQSGQQYVVEATANWDVTWSGATSGAQDVPLTSTTALQIGEIQVIVTG